jgi:hypothetical protein
MVKLCEPKYGGSSDDVWWPTLVHRRTAYAGPMKPASGLTVHLSEGRAVLSWWGSVGATSYVVKRGPTVNGPFTHLATVPASHLLTHTDTPPKGVWFYQVITQGSGAASASSDVVRLAVPGELRLMMPLNGRSGLGTFGMLQTPGGKWTGVQGKLLDGATWGEGRLNDKAVMFDGKSASLQLSPGVFSGLEDFTISLWAYANSLHWDSCVFFSGQDGFSYMCIVPQGGPGVLRFVIAGAGHNDSQAVEASSALPVRRWVHLAVTLQGTTGRLYVDGKEVGRANDIVLSPRQVGEQVTFLGRGWSHSSFDGRIQGLRVDAGALNATEIAALAK